MLVARLANSGKLTAPLFHERLKNVLTCNQTLQANFRQGNHDEVLVLYQRMQFEGTRPNASTFPCVLGSCTHLSVMQFGEMVHASTVTTGCQTDRYVASSLVNFYAKFHRMGDAFKVFEQMPQRSVVSWTALIQGYIRIGASDKAVEMFERMQWQDGIKPNDVAVLSLIPACFDLRDCESVHALVIKLGFDSYSLIATSVVDIYMKCEDVDNAKQVFYGLYDKNDVTWLVMVSGLAKNCLLGDAILLASRMLLDLKLILDSTSLVNLISACTVMRALGYGKLVHTYMIKAGVEMDVFVGTALLNMYAKYGDWEYSRRLFDGLSEQNLVAWNAILHLYARCGFLEGFLDLFGRLKQTGLCPDSVTVRNCILALVSSSTYQRKSELGECIHGFAIKCGFFYSEVATANSILDFYGKMGDLKHAEELFSCIEDRRDTISWNCLISAYVNSGFSDKAIMLFYRMQTEHVMPDSFTLSNVLSACACTGLRTLGQCVHACLTKQGYSYILIWDSYVGTSLVDMYAKCGHVQSAYKVFQEIQFRDAATWNAMVAGFSQNGYTSQALALFYYHLKATGGSLVSDSAVATAISTCSQVGHLDVGKSLHGYILRKGLDGDVKVGNAILSLYSKCGLVEDAELLFKRMVEKDTTSWTALIAGYGMNGRAKDAVSLFEEMTKEKAGNAKPNEVTFLEVLWACSHGGLVKEGWDYFDRMRRVYRIKAKAEHYCCVVDLLGRSGYLYEAYVLIRSMEVRADAAVWGAFMSACSIHGELELGEIAEEELLRADEEKKSSYHVLLSNAFASGERWEHAARLREAHGWGSWNKAPGWSLIEVRD